MMDDETIRKIRACVPFVDATCPESITQTQSAITDLFRQRDDARARAEKAEGGVASLRNFMLTRPAYAERGQCPFPCGAAITEIKRLDGALAVAEARADRLAALVREMRPYMMYPPVATVALDAAHSAVEAAGDLKEKRP